MGNEFYIIENGELSGPFDLVSMIKKIRNGKLTADTLVQEERFGHKMPAAEVKDLMEYFSEDTRTELFEDNMKPIESIDVLPLIKDAWSTFCRHQSMSIAAGVMTIGVIAVSYVLSSILPALFSAFLSAAAAGLAIFGFLIYTVCKMRNIVMDADFKAEIMAKNPLQLVIAAAVASALCFGIPTLIASAISDFGYVLMIPGIVGFGFFILAPLYWFDETETSARGLLMRSKNWLLAQHIDTMGVILFLIFINCFAAFFFLFPLFVSLPVTAIAIVSIYDDYILHQ